MFKNKGFTILELLVVLTVISILIGVAIPRIKGMQDEANKAKAKSETRTIQAALESYYINHSPNVYPATSTTVCASSLNGATPKIVSGTLYDPFLSSTEYNYVRSSNGKYYVAFSVGPDGAADITGINDSGVLQGTNDDDVYASNGSGF